MRNLVLKKAQAKENRTPIFDTGVIFARGENLVIILILLDYVN